LAPGCGIVDEHVNDAARAGRERHQLIEVGEVGDVADTVGGLAAVGLDLRADAVEGLRAAAAEEDARSLRCEPLAIAAPIPAGTCHDRRAAGEAVLADDHAHERAAVVNLVVTDRIKDHAACAEQAPSPSVANALPSRGGWPRADKVPAVRVLVLGRGSGAGADDEARG